MLYQFCRDGLHFDFEPCLSLAGRTGPFLFLLFNLKAGVSSTISDTAGETVCSDKLRSAQLMERGTVQFLLD